MKISHIRLLCSFLFVLTILASLGFACTCSKVENYMSGDRIDFDFGQSAAVFTGKVVEMEFRKGVPVP